MFQGRFNGSWVLCWKSWKPSYWYADDACIRKSYCTKNTPMNSCKPSLTGQQVTLSKLHVHVYLWCRGMYVWKSHSIFMSNTSLLVCLERIETLRFLRLAAVYMKTSRNVMKMSRVFSHKCADVFTCRHPASRKDFDHCALYSSLLICILWVSLCRITSCVTR